MHKFSRERGSIDRAIIACGCVCVCLSCVRTKSGGSEEKAD